MTHVDFAQSACRAAIGRRDITPPIGMYHRMWGAATHDRSTGLHRPLLATALVLAASSSEAVSAADSAIQALVGIDHCLLWTEEMDALRAAVCSDTGLSPDQLHVTFSHTHAAGLMDPRRADLPGGELIAGYLNQLAKHVAGAIREALHSLQNAHIVYGHGHCDLARNRDFWDSHSQQYVCGFNPAGPEDDTVVVARISDEVSRTLGTVVNYACHPTTLAWDNSHVSPDFVGATREVIETATAAPCLFLQGASGDLGPRHGFVGSARVADANGRQLGYAALSALESLPPAGMQFAYTGPVVSGATIGTWDYRPLAREVLFRKRLWRCRRFQVELACRPDLPARDETEQQLTRWQAEEQAAHDRGDAQRARDCRAQSERMARQLARLRSVPAGETVPLCGAVWRLGDAFWVTVQAEHYQLLQRSLRARFPTHPIIVATMTNGWQPGYLPTAETYGRGIYQESIAIVSPGSLERVIDVIAAYIEEYG